MEAETEAASIPNRRTFAKRCRKIRRALGEREIDLGATGSQDNNKLVSLLKCESRARRKCEDVSKRYAQCHAAIMGVGMFKGKRNCRNELASWLQCVTTP
uniref:Uncharacterized protein n=1 Tax=Lotharella oceanica TaxID=641309 RepID=A0A7S2TYY2_9EUKA